MKLQYFAISTLIVLVAAEFGAVAASQPEWVTVVETCKRNYGLATGQNLMDLIETLYRANSDLEIKRRMLQSVGVDKKLCSDLQGLVQISKSVMRALEKCSIEETSKFYFAAQHNSNHLEVRALKFCSYDPEVMKTIAKVPNLLIFDLNLQSEKCRQKYGHASQKYLMDAFDTLNAKLQILKEKPFEMLCSDILSSTKSGHAFSRAMSVCAFEATSVFQTDLKTSMDLMAVHARIMCGDKLIDEILTPEDPCREQAMMEILRCNYFDAKKIANTTQVIKLLNKKAKGIDLDCRGRSKTLNCVLEKGRLLQNCSEEVQQLMNGHLKTLINAPNCFPDWVGKLEERSA